MMGIVGYHYLENMPLDDALLNSATTLAGIGPLKPIYTLRGKIFVSCYVIYSSLLFIVAMWILIVPVIHRMFHHLFHYNSKDE
jgi:hypothetical protein